MFTTNNSTFVGWKYDVLITDRTSIIFLNYFRLYNKVLLFVLGKFRPEDYVHRENLHNNKENYFWLFTEIQVWVAEGECEKEVTMGKEKKEMENE